MLQNSVLNTETAPSASMIAKALKWQCFFGMIVASILRRMAMSAENAPTKIRPVETFWEKTERRARQLRGISMFALASVIMTGCDKDKGGVEPTPDPKLPLLEKVTLPTSAMTLGYLGDQHVFTSSRTSGSSWGNIVSNVNKGNIKVRFDAQTIDSVRVNPYGTVIFYDREGGPVRAHITSDNGPVATDGKEDITEVVLESQSLGFLINREGGNIPTETAMQFVENAAKIPFSVQPTKFEAAYNGNKLTLK